MSSGSCTNCVSSVRCFEHFTHRELKSVVHYLYIVMYVGMHMYIHSLLCFFWKVSSCDTKKKEIRCNQADETSSKRKYG